MKAILLAGATLAAAACSSEPTAAVRAPAHKTSAEEGMPGEFLALSDSSSAEPTTTVEATTTTTEPEPVATTVPYVAPVTTRRATTTVTVYVEPRSPQSNTSDGPWAIPTYIVMCESGGNWNAQNASGAAGPYQLMPEHFGGESALNQSRDAQHAMAARLWNGGAGARNWAECL